MLVSASNSSSHDTGVAVPANASNCHRGTGRYHYVPVLTCVLYEKVCFSSVWGRLNDSSTGPFEFGGRCVLR